MRSRLLVSTVMIALSLVACHKAAPKEVELGAAFHNLPLPPNGQALDRQGGPEAMQVIFVTPVMPDSVVEYYRNVLSTDPFHLVNERKSGNTTAFYAEQDAGPPLWVTVSPNGSEGANVVLAGAKDPNSVDTATGRLKTADSGASTSLPVRKP